MENSAANRERSSTISMRARCQIVEAIRWQRVAFIFSFAKTFVMGSLTLADREANLIEQSLEESSYIYSFIHCS